MSENIRTDVVFAVNSTPSLQAPDHILLRRLDAFEVLQMTLEDVQSYQAKDSISSGGDISNVLDRVEMCCRFLETASWADKDGVIENVVLKMIEIHMNLSNGKLAETHCINSGDWVALGSILTSMDYLECPEQPSSQLLSRDFPILKLMIVDRITQLLICGPLEFGNCSTQQLLERIELCQRYLDDKDSDLQTLKIVSDDILGMVNLFDIYEVMEFWESINFKGWVTNIKTMNKSPHDFSLWIKARKMYSEADIQDEKIAFENHWRNVLSSKSTDYQPPTMMKCYPDHPYLSYAKKNRSVLRRNGKTKSVDGTTARKPTARNKTELTADNDDKLVPADNNRKAAVASISDNCIYNMELKDHVPKLQAKANEFVTNASESREDSRDNGFNVVVLQPHITKEVEKYTIPTFSELGAQRSYGSADQMKKIPVIDTIQKMKSGTVKKVVSVIQSERKRFSYKIREQNKDSEINLGASKTPMFIRVGVPQNLRTQLHSSIENFIVTNFDKKVINKSPERFLKTISKFKDFCSEMTGEFLEFLRDHVAESILDIIPECDSRKEALINSLMIYVALRVKALHKAVEQLQKCCDLSSNQKSEVLEMTTFSVKDVFKKLAVVCCTDKLVVSSES